jgi:hypothetical protein
MIFYVSIFFSYQRFLKVRFFINLEIMETLAIKLISLQQTASE